MGFSWSIPGPTAALDPLGLRERKQRRALGMSLTQVRERRFPPARISPSITAREENQSFLWQRAYSIMQKVMAFYTPRWRLHEPWAAALPFQTCAVVFQFVTSISWKPTCLSVLCCPRSPQRQDSAPTGVRSVYSHQEQQSITQLT